MEREKRGAFLEVFGCLKGDEDSEYLYCSCGGGATCIMQICINSSIESYTVLL